MQGRRDGAIEYKPLDQFLAYPTVPSVRPSDTVAMLSKLPFVGGGYRSGPYRRGEEAGDDVRWVVDPDVRARGPDEEHENERPDPHTRLQGRVFEPVGDDPRDGAVKAERGECMAAGEAEPFC